MNTESSPIQLERLNDYVEKWAKIRPDHRAMVQHEDGKTITYKDFSKLIDFFALRLLDMGIEKGDRVATQLVLVPEHMILMYACFKIGAIFAPLDVRLTESEVVRDVNKIQPKAFFFLGDTPVKDFRAMGRAVQADCPSVAHLIQFTPNPKAGDILEGAWSITQMMDKKRLVWLKVKEMVTGRLEKIYSGITARTPALIIYTTGTTGAPKPALLCHENIIVQNQVLVRGFGSSGDDPDFICLVNLPPSHVGCVTETFMTTLFMGGTTILLRIFDAKLSLEAIQTHKVTALGQIPTMFRMQWNLPEFGAYDLSSLEFVVYGGSSVDNGFLKKMAAMAPRFGTGLGATENAGFGTFTPQGISIEEMAGQVGQAFDDLAKISIREPMNADGTAGIALPDHAVGEICYHPPIVFLGYFDQPEATASAISKEGILYTGDLGCFKPMDGYRALYLAGRRKFVIKQKGYNVFPGEVEEYLAGMAGVEMAEVVGMKHELFDEGIFAFVQPKAGVEITSADVMAHCKGIAAYKRPAHVEIWPSDREFPLTRSTKVDKMGLTGIAAPIIQSLREKGLWDAGTLGSV